MTYEKEINLAKIKVLTTQNADIFEVNVNDDDGTNSAHKVTFSEAVYAKLPHGDRSREDCLKAAFLFLLDREPKEMILRQFEFSIIKRYFPEFENLFGQYLEKI